MAFEKEDSPPTCSLPLRSSSLMPVSRGVARDVRRSLNASDSHNDLRRDVEPRTPTKSAALPESSISGDSPKLSSLQSSPHPGTDLTATKTLDFSSDSDTASDMPRLKKHVSKALLPRALQSKTDLTQSDPSPTKTAKTIHPGSESTPIRNFRPNLWKHLDEQQKVVNLDLFWPIDLEEDEDTAKHKEEHELDTFPLEELRPLSNFRRLKTLKIGGMMRSYQKYIWMCCWANSGIEDLALEMALEPRIDNQNIKWSWIKGNWVYRKDRAGSTEYRGEGGKGVLNYDIGDGEYLDQLAIEEAMKDTVHAKSGPHRLSIAKLTLSGFVVDAGPFRRLFNPSRLRQIHFKDNCIDAGFALPDHLKRRVNVTWPKDEHAGHKCAKAVGAQKVSLKDLKIVELKKGKVVSSSPVEFKDGKFMLGSDDSQAKPAPKLSRKKGMNFKEDL